jgi:hypothetical protein
MDEVRISRFDDHSRFKCICIFMDEVQEEIIIKQLFAKLSEFL